MRITPRPVEVEHQGIWRPGLLRSWEIDPDGEESGVVTFTNDRGEPEVHRFSASQVRET